MWNFQFDRKDGALARDLLDRQLLPYLANWFADAENGENGSLALADLGAPVRQYATKKSHTTKSDTSGVQGTSMDAYLQAASAFVPTSVKGPHQPARKRGFRPKKFRGSRSYAEIVNEQQNLQPSNFPTLPSTGTAQDPVVITSAPSQQMPQAHGNAPPQPSAQVTGNVSPNSSLSSDSAKISELTNTVETLRSESAALRETNSQMEARMTLRIQEIVAEQIAEAQAKWTQNLDTQTEWMLKSALTASAARTDATATLLTDRIDQIGEMVSQLVNQKYNPIGDQNAADKATEEAMAAAVKERPLLPAPSPIVPAPLADTSDISQSSTATGSQSAAASITSQDAALILEQRTAMSDSNSRKRSAEDHPKDIALSAPAAPPDPKRHTQ
jgi:hypothetical protein